MALVVPTDAPLVAIRGPVDIPAEQHVHVGPGVRRQQDRVEEDRVRREAGVEGGEELVDEEGGLASKAWVGRWWILGGGGGCPRRFFW